MLHPKQYEGRQVVVLGLARSGVAVARLFRECGALVVANDRKERSLCPEADALADLGIRVVCGGHPDGLIDENTALVVKNPGIPYSIAPVQQAFRLGVEVVTEVEVAAHLSRSPIIGITGSNGKTTTTTLVGLMLQEAGMRAAVAGNIGRALTEAALESDSGQWLVAELSSFQLKGTRDFRPSIACLLNLYETHMDYHGTMDDYARSKARLFANQTESDTAVVNWDDPYCRSIAPGLRGRLFPFSAKERLPSGVFVDRGTMVYSRGAEPEAAVPILPVSRIAIRGSHNVENALAAAAVALSAGAGRESVRAVLETFRGVEHRLEYVREHRGVQFYNDSKATNPAATARSVEAFDERPVILICGGLDRGSDYMELLPVFRRSVTGVVALGETKAKLLHVAQAAGIGRCEPIDESDPETAIRRAVEAAFRLAAPGETVLLSPACASWDMFPSYEDRGRMFKHSVHTL